MDAEKLRSHETIGRKQLFVPISGLTVEPLKMGTDKE